MALHPQTQSALAQFTVAAKTILFNAGRFEKILPMLNTRNGAITAVHAVIATIEKTKPVPPDVLPLLSVNIYMLMVDMAQEIIGKPPVMKMVKRTVDELLTSVIKSYNPAMPMKGALKGPQAPQQAAQPQAPAQAQPTPPMPAPAAPGGMIQQGA